MCFSGALCGDNHTARPWWPTEQRWGIPATEKVFTDCCFRRVPASETICRIHSQEIPVGGYGDYQDKWPWPKCDAEGYVIEERERINWFSFASYYDPTWRIECNPDGGCKANPRKKLGMHLRDRSHY